MALMSSGVLCRSIASLIMWGNLFRNGYIFHALNKWYRFRIEKDHAIHTWGGGPPPPCGVAAVGCCGGCWADADEEEDDACGGGSDCDDWPPCCVEAAPDDDADAAGRCLAPGGGDSGCSLAGVCGCAYRSRTCEHWCKLVA